MNLGLYFVEDIYYMYSFQLYFHVPNKVKNMQIAIDMV